MQAVGQLVEVGEPGRDAGQPVAAVAGRLDLVDRALDDVAERQVVLARAALGDGVDLRLGAVDERVDVPAARGVAELDDLRTGVHEPAQHGALPDDLGVVAGVGRRRHRRDQRVQVGRAAHAAQLAPLGQLSGHGHGVRRLAPAVEVEHRVEDELVGRAVEVGAAQHLHHVRDRVLAQHHAAEHALLGGDVLRRGAAEVLRRWAGLLVLAEIGERHRESLLAALSSSDRRCRVFMSNRCTPRVRHRRRRRPDSGCTQTLGTAGSPEPANRRVACARDGDGLWTAGHQTVDASTDLVHSRWPELCTEYARRRRPRG